jgi:hypothetical protein
MAADVWFNSPVPKSETDEAATLASLSNLPDCAFGSLSAIVQGPGIVKLEWDRIECTNITAAFENSGLANITCSNIHIWRHNVK